MSIRDSIFDFLQSSSIDFAFDFDQNYLNLSRIIRITEHKMKYQ